MLLPSSFKITSVIEEYAVLLVIVFAALLFVNKAAATEMVSDNKLVIKDYGTQGHLFDIKEPSIITEIMEKLLAAKESGELDQLQKEFTNKVKEKVLRPTPVRNIKKATINRSWTYNPTYTQKTAITDDKGSVIVPAGTVVNALDKLQWGQALIFIDGEDEEQIQWAKKQLGKIVLTNGAPLQISDQLKQTVYFDQAGILCYRFKIEAVPALVEQEGNLLKISEVKL